MGNFTSNRTKSVRKNLCLIQSEINRKSINESQFSVFNSDLCCVASHAVAKRFLVARLLNAVETEQTRETPCYCRLLLCLSESSQTERR